MFAIFENCSYTSEDSKSPLKPLEFTASCERVYQKIQKDVVEKNYYGVEIKKDFYEIYYWYLGFEVTISLTPSTEVNNKTYLNIMVYGEKKRGRTRKMLKNLLNYYQDLLKDL